MPDDNPVRSATRGLATVALLKVNFDAGRDHLSMFEPFVIDTLTHMSIDSFSVDELRTRIKDRHQLELPVNALSTLLGRAVRSGYVRREGGRHFRTDKQSTLSDLATQRAKVERRQRGLADALRERALLTGVEVATTEDALAMILNFLDRFHVSLALDEVAEPHPNAALELGEETEADRQSALTADFLESTVLAEGELAKVVQEMLEGFVLQNCLLLKDISAANRRFANLRAFFDSGLLFGALGYRGAATETATRELLSLLQDTGATLNIFETTVQEMLRILRVYEERIGTASGRQSLHPYDLTRFFLTNRYTPSDIRTAITFLRSNLSALGFTIRAMPAHKVATTFDEADLCARLASRPGGEGDQRVVHDTDCVAGVLTLRRGHFSDSLDHAGSVFVTTSGLTVRSVTEWYEAQGGRGVPPIIHSLLLSNLAWLKRPASASKLKLHELVALCSSALRPSRKAWVAFQSHLRRLQESGELSSDEMTAIVANALTDNILAEAAIDDETEADTLTEVVERVKAGFKEAAEDELAQARASAESELALARESAEHSDQDARQLRLRLEGKARSFARIGSWFGAALVMASFATGTIVSIVDGGARKSTRPSPSAFCNCAVGHRWLSESDIGIPCQRMASGRREAPHSSCAGVAHRYTYKQVATPSAHQLSAVT